MHPLTRREFAAAVVAGAAAVPVSGSQSAPPAARPAPPPPSAQDDTLAALSLAEVSSQLQSGKATSEALTRACLARIAVYQPKLNAFISVLGERALAQAKALDAERKAGKVRGPLHGIPIALKDNIDTAGIRTTAASAVFDDRVPTDDAEVTRRLAAAGAVLIGKTNLHEFAAGGTSATSYFGPVRNPWALDRNPGGSSGGSAAAVAAALCYAALGTDTGGSIRTPSSNCGTVGIKPTYGLVSIRGIIPLTFSLDHCGPITRTVRDAALVLQALAGYDTLDIASVAHPAEDYVAALDQPVRALRVGVPRAPFFDLLDADVEAAVATAIAVIAKMTAGVRDCTLPPVADIVLTGEMGAYHLDYFAQMPGRYMLPTRRSLNAAKDFRASEYVRGKWKLELLRRTIDDAFADVDLVVLPTRKRTPRTLDAAMAREQADVPRNPELENTNAFNAYGIPAISVPCGFSADGLPIGLMIAGPRFSEGRVLALAQAFEKATDWHTRRPPLRPDTAVPPLKATDEDR